MEQSPSWEAYNHSAIQEIHYRVHNILQKEMAIK
jgi:hypothetical protein